MSQRCVREAVFTDRLQIYVSQRSVTEVLQKCHKGMLQICHSDVSQRKGHKEVTQKHHRSVDVSQHCHSIVTNVSQHRNFIGI